MVSIKQNLSNRNNYGGKRSLSKIKYIVIHYTGNDGDSDESNARWFKNIRKASAHYFVDDDSITQSVPDNYVAWSVGGAKYNNSGGRLFEKCVNTNSISIEMCDDLRNGVVYPTDKTIQNTLELVEYLMNEYSIPKSNVIRHYDVNGKPCPKYWVNDAKWKSEFWNKIGGGSVNTTNTTMEKYKKQVKERFGFSDQTIEWLATYKHAEALFTKLATKK